MKHATIFCITFLSCLSFSQIMNAAEIRILPTMIKNRTITAAKNKVNLYEGTVHWEIQHLPLYWELQYLPFGKIFDHYYTFIPEATLLGSHRSNVFGVESPCPFRPFYLKLPMSILLFWEPNKLIQARNSKGHIMIVDVQRINLIS